MALRGINLPLAWVRADKILADVFHDVGLTVFFSQWPGVPGMESINALFLHHFCG